MWVNKSLFWFELEILKIAVFLDKLGKQNNFTDLSEITFSKFGNIRFFGAWRLTIQTFEAGFEIFAELFQSCQKFFFGDDFLVEFPIRFVQDRPAHGVQAQPSPLCKTRINFADDLNEILEAFDLGFQPFRTEGFVFKPDRKSVQIPEELLDC